MPLGFGRGRANHQNASTRRNLRVLSGQPGSCQRDERFVGGPVALVFIPRFFPPPVGLVTLLGVGEGDVADNQNPIG